MQSNVVNLSGKVLRSIDLDDRVFGITPNEAVVHQAVVTQQANARQGTHDTRTRGEVAGGGKKPYRQKGTGHARQGSRRAPHYKGGGVVFGPHPRSYEKALPRKMRRLALRSVLSARLAADALTIVDAFELDTPKTKTLLAALSGLGITSGALVVTAERSDGVWRAAHNLERVHVVTPNGLNLLDILRLPRLVLTEGAITELTRTLTSDLKPAGGEAAPAPTPAAEPPTPTRRRARTEAAPSEGVAPTTSPTVEEAIGDTQTPPERPARTRETTSQTAEEAIDAAAEEKQ
jgi:large subunit ribosomal protein L4